MIEFCFDKVGVPNLVASDQFSDMQWPYITRFRLLMYLERSGGEYKISSIDQHSDRAWYPIGLGWFDHALDYFALLDGTVQQHIRSGTLRILFYYHEGDNPERIKKRLDFLVTQHQFPLQSYLFVSANTRARDIENFVYFSDHEVFFRHVNRSQTRPEIVIKNRPFVFTALNRLHKWWRASCMADLEHMGALESSLWSYNTAGVDIGIDNDNPFELDSVPGWRTRVHDFLRNTPKYCDTADSVQHNSHAMVNLALYQDSWCHVVFETHFDADQSSGVFLTEKTFKPIKFGQPFVIVGPAGSLQELRKSGYRVFDSIIDNEYDTIVDTTQRWQYLKKTLEEIKSLSGPEWFSQCLSDLKHNQQMFLSRSSEPLNRFIKEISWH